MEPLFWPAKDPDDVLDFVIDWSQWLGDDTIAASTWIMPSGITENSSQFSNTTATIWVAGGTDGTLYSITNRITTASGRQRDQSVTLPVQTN